MGRDNFIVFLYGGKIHSSKRITKMADKPLVWIVLGSTSDLPKLTESGIVALMERAGLEIVLNVISNRRHACDEWPAFINLANEQLPEAVLFVGSGAAYGNNPGAFGWGIAHTRTLVLAVALEGKTDPNGDQTLHSIIDDAVMPLALCAGRGLVGLKNASWIIIRQFGNPGITATMFREFLETKPAQVPYTG